MSIEAPYNFVPLNDKVFYPSWSEEVSHDIPFEDGESLEIDIEVQAESPVFIRNHFQDGDEFYKDKEGNKISKEFCHVKTSDGSKQYYIPGSSIKGMLRNILEIMSFGKIRVDKEKLSKSLSVRDMTPKQYCLDPNIRKMKDCPQNQRANLFNHSMVATAQKCGFLIINNDGSGTLEDCAQPITIHHMELQNGYGIKDIKNLESAKDKYKLVGDYLKDVKVKVQNQGRQKKAYFQGADTDATLVFTGKIDNKKHEFIFVTTKNEKTIEKTVIDNFKKVYFQNEDAIDGQYWFSKYKKNNAIKIPVFYTDNKKGTINAIGLTQIFKLAYSKTLFEASQQDNLDDKKLDLAETIFGTEKDGVALKGRVQFSHLKSSTVRFEKEVEQVLASPNPTYYPNYIRQTDINGTKVNKYITLMDKDAQISGYKRYPLQNTIQWYKLPQNDDGKVNHDVATKFKPLDTGTTFSGKLRFHNLKKAEIGALLSALTFHGQGENNLHNIGMAKSLGYGKIKISINGLEKLTYPSKEYLDSFEEMMNTWDEKLYEQWNSSVQIRELFAMHNNTKSKSLRYQLLENDRGKNDFVEDKKQRKFLRNYSADNRKTKIIHSKNENSNNQERKSNESVNSQNNGLKIVQKDSKKTSKQNSDNNEPLDTKQEVKEYTIGDISKEIGVSKQEVLKFIKASNLPIKKDINENDKLKEAQAKGLINKMKKSQKD